MSSLAITGKRHNPLSSMPYPTRNAVLSLSAFLPALTAGAKLAGRNRLARAAFLASHAVVLYPVLKRNCGWLGPIVTSFQTESKSVWLTIDDGPDPNTTPEILDLLNAHHAKASFFCIGKKVDRHRDLCRRIVREGHTLENHSYDHAVATFWGNAPSQLRREVQRTTHAIRVATGVPPRYFRSPVGMTNPFVHPVLEQEGLQLVGWNCDGFDGVNRSSRAVLKCLLPKIKPGAVILVHEGSSHGSTRIATLQLLLQHLTMRGYSCMIPSPESLIA